MSGAIQILGVDGVTIKNLTITPSDVSNELSGIYLNDAEDITITGNTFQGSNQEGSGVINTDGGGGQTVSLLTSPMFHVSGCHSGMSTRTGSTPASRMEVSISR